MLAPKKAKRRKVMARSRGLKHKMRRKNDAERRRRALRAFMVAHGLKPAAWSRQAGLKTPNSIYNFLSGRADSLASKTLELLARASGVTVDQLIGSSVTNPNRGIVTIKVTGSAEAGLWGAADIPVANQRVFTMTASRQQSAVGKTYGLVVSGTSMNLLYPPGTILECLDLHDHEGELVNGNRVIVHRRNKERLLEVSCREFRLAGGLAWLWPRSDDPEWQTPLSLPWPPSTNGAGPQELEIVIKAVVIRSIREEI